MMKGKRKYKEMIENVLFSLHYIWKNARKHFILQLVFAFVEGAYAPLNLVLSAWLFNALDENKTVKETVFIILIMAGVMVLYYVSTYIYYFVFSPRMEKRLCYQIQTSLLSNTLKIEYEKYNDPKYYDNFLIVLQSADSYLLSAINNMKSIISILFSLIATVSLFSLISPFAILIISVSAIISLFISIKLRIIDFESEIEKTTLEKKEKYVDRVFKLPDLAKELRITELDTVLLDEYQNNTKRYIEYLKKYGKKRIFLHMCDYLNSNLVFIALVIFSLFQIINNGILLGAFVITINAGWQLRGAINQMTELIANLPKQSRFIGVIREFIENKTFAKPKEKLLAPFEKIEFCDVSFGYDNINVLNDINLCIHKGEHIAIVGANGAGKSTLIKLLLKLYTPSNGVIKYNNVNIESFENDSYCKKLGVAFQDYKIFSASIAENVLSDFYNEIDKNRVIKALRLATFEEKLKTLELGVHTTLTKEFDKNGVNLSGGEQQKIAIARALAKECEIIIMDEPSSALDPIAEQLLSDNISKYVRDKTVIYISHRLSTTKDVDCIYVLDGGRVVEQGSHRQLMKVNGKYAQMFLAQSQKYQNDCKH